MSTNPTIFRKDALNRLSSPEQLDQAMRVTRPRAWLALVGLGAVLLMALVWGINGRIPITMEQQGLLVRPGSLRNAVALNSGQVSEVKVKPGDIIEPGQAVASLLAPSANAPEQITSPFGGRVLAVTVGPGDLLERGATVLTLEPIDNRLELVMYVPVDQVNTVRPGAEVQISPPGISREEYGFLRGKVRSVADYPSTATAMRQTLGTDELVETFSGDTAVVEVRVDLERAGDLPGRYAWSTEHGLQVELRSGMVCDVDVILGDRRLLNVFE